MQEEFHGENYADGTYKRKLLYGWNNLNANVWLPSLKELVGITGTQNTTNGCYKSAMQGINLSTVYWTDAQGGVQFSYFAQYNLSGGGQKIWNVCKQEQCWLRSPDLGRSTTAWRTTNSERFDVPGCTYSLAVHPAV